VTDSTDLRQSRRHAKMRYPPRPVFISSATALSRSQSIALTRARIPSCRPQQLQSMSLGNSYICHVVLAAQSPSTNARRWIVTSRKSV